MRQTPILQPVSGRPVRVLFVCLGNICRSPSAEGVFRHLVSEAGQDEAFEIDSAGIIGHHEGELPDGRMRAHAARRGYDLTSRSRPIRYEDFFHFDYIIGMDHVPDPYYGGAEGFEHVLDLLEHCLPQLQRQIHP